MKASDEEQTFVPGVILRRADLDEFAGVDPCSPEFKRRISEHRVRRKELEELQEVARVATRAALEDYEAIPLEWSSRLTLGTLFDGDDRIFELYVAGERPIDAIVLTSARVDRHSRAVAVTVSNLIRRTRPPSTGEA